MKALTRVGEDDDVARRGPNPGVQRRRFATGLVASNKPYRPTRRLERFAWLPGGSPVYRHDDFHRRRHVDRLEAVLHTLAYGRRVVTGRDHNGDSTRHGLQMSSAASNPASRQA